MQWHKAENSISLIRIFKANKYKTFFRSWNYIQVIQAINELKDKHISNKQYRLLKAIFIWKQSTVW